MGEYSRRHRDFYFKCQIWEARKFKTRKKIFLHIDTNAPKERYQADTVHLSLVLHHEISNMF